MAVVRLEVKGVPEKKLTTNKPPPIRRNCIFLAETVEAALSTLSAMLETWQDATLTPPPPSKPLRASTLRALSYRKRTFKSTLLSVQSSEKRVSSSIAVYQALVTQNDSRAMKFIAVLTLIFLPVTGVSTVFSSPFFDVDFDDYSTPLRVARCFWKFWAIVAPLTLGIGFLCYFWFQFPKFFAFVPELMAPRGWGWRGRRGGKKGGKSVV